MMVQMHNHSDPVGTSPTERPVTCEEFQGQMADLLGDGIRDHQHLKTCERCRELLEELEYIAVIAGDLLLPVHEPGDKVWQNISASLSKSPDETAKLNGHMAGSSFKR